MRRRGEPQGAEVGSGDAATPHLEPQRRAMWTVHSERAKLLDLCPRRSLTEDGPRRGFGTSG